ncbi:UDP-N-acetylglucosamine 2-epimerase [Marinospirillum insulare]|uniref:UDP-N-acetyl glucosamine 2-epimerase n=1 Tax=Marinospirillum insulare TaxID=217169 RepID=A0ABQ5ZYR9_9GAMM|nr:UDP-N-acetylglucosamine 2-epimerase [Marinospirillum insulare]GLR63050.1 UDP-N-acetyl glucosamine 2-epimerase [Marinospirillum insulare]
MKKIAVFTGTRAEYGLLYWVIKYLHEAPEVSLQLMVGGMHLSPEFGYTVKQIEEDGFLVTERLDFLLSSDSPVAISKSMALATISAAEAFERNQPDLLVVLGDRFESMAVSQAAMIARVPIAHIHGGETTEGLIDEAVRHSITKMAHLHFTATEAYRKRVIQLGEHPELVFNTGAPGIDSIKKLPLISKKELSSAVGFNLDKPYFVVTYHPVTLEVGGGSISLEYLLAALDEYPEYQAIISYPNADTDGRRLIKILDKYQELHPDRVFLVRSLGQLKYLSALKHCVAVLGNSSSGLIEAPTFGVPTLNIGNRQKGRLCGETVVSCGESKTEILAAMKKILNPDFQESCRKAINPYGSGNASEKIVKQLLSHSLDNLLEKSFYDMECDE